MRLLNAILLVTLSHHVVGCGGVTGHMDEVDCADGKCDGQSGFARPVVRSQTPLALANPQEDAIRWPIWGSAFSTAEVVKAQVTLAATGRGGLAFVGDERAFALRWTGSEWALTGPGQRKTLRVPADTEWLIEVGEGGRSVQVTSTTGKTAKVTSDTRTGATMGIYVELEPGSELAIDQLSLSQELPETTLGTPLQALAGAKGRAFGSTSETGQWPPRHDLAFEAMYAREFGTAGILDFYWTTTRGEDDDFHFLPADLMVNYATVHGQTIDGYFLVWDEELPAWVGEVADAEGPEGLGVVFDAHIQATVERYRGRVGSWIVANEAFLGPDENGTDQAGYAESIWYDTLGPDFIARAFRVADSVDPTAKLVYNETGAEAEGAKSDFMYEQVRELVQRQIPIDAVGFQFHVDAAVPPDMASVKRNMQRFAALGLDVMITELDVSLANLPGTEAQRFAKQAAIYKDVIATCLAVPRCSSITTFGFSDKHAWDELGITSAPLLFTRDYEPKPAYESVRAALAR